MSRGAAVALGMCVAGVAGVGADAGAPVDLATRVRGASRAVVATVVHAESRWVTTAAGDRVIVTQAVARIHEALKGPNTGTLVVEFEGGAVGEQSMRASDMDVLPVGRRAVLLVEPTPAGTWRPHRRGLGVLPLDAADRVAGTGVTLADVRRAARVAGGAR